MCGITNPLGKWTEFHGACLVCREMSLTAHHLIVEMGLPDPFNNLIQFRLIR